MKKAIQLCFLFVLICMLSACVNLNKKIQEDVNVLQAKVQNTEESIKKLDTQNNELREIVAGEQKRGEYLQRQITEMVNKLQSDIVTLEASIAGRRAVTPQRTVSKTTTQAKFISDKMQSPPSVKDVQLALRNAGFYDGAIDGKVGSKSKEGVKEFQRSYGLTADGVVGEKELEDIIDTNDFSRR
ncbi:peptidoglycan-binding protein, partial [Candidatus Omnitrophota bacterium]